jgi:predicted secreted protein
MQDHSQLGGRPAAPKRSNTRRLVVTILIIVVVAAVLGYFVVDILETATRAMKGG